MKSKLFIFIIMLSGQIGCLAQPQKRYDDNFNRLWSLPWEEVFSDCGTCDWTQKWTLDGIYARFDNTADGMRLSAGPEAGNHAHHAVLWSRQIFEGDVMIEYDFLRNDTSKANAVNIIYIQAQGSGEPGFGKDISTWADKRELPAMKLYFDNMDTYHISYATDGIAPAPESGHYVRARRYMPAMKQGLEGTDLAPDYLNVDMFKPDITYHITIIKSGSELYFKAEGEGDSNVFYFDGSTHPPVEKGRIGLRHMYTRSATYTNIRIYELK